MSDLIPVVAHASATRIRISCQTNGQLITDIAPDAISDLIEKRDHFVWLDISNPDEHAVALIRD
jgi:Mg2+ and Co2+ transporter CorA